MKKLLAKSVILITVTIISSCSTNGVRDYHRSSSAGETRLETRYLHNDVAFRLKDIGQAPDLLVPHQGYEANFTLKNKLYLSYHPAQGYILEAENDKEGRFFVLGKNDFSITAKNRSEGIIKMSASDSISRKAATVPQQKSYVSLAGYVTRTELGYYMPEAITEMTIEKSGSKLSFCWKDKSGKEIIYHGNFPQDNFVIESAGDLLSTSIAFEQQYSYNFARREGCYHGWKQEDITFFGYCYKNNKPKEYGWRNPAPRMKQ